MSGPYDPFNNISYLDINKRKRGEDYRDEAERLENRYEKPLVKKLYLKRNGEEKSEKPKLFIWRQRTTPTLRHLLEDLGPFLSLPDEAANLYDIHGRRITHEDEIRDRSTYYVTGDEPLILYVPSNPLANNFSSDDYPRRSETRAEGGGGLRHSSMSAPELQSFSRNSLYSDLNAATPPPRPHSAQLPKRKKIIKKVVRTRQPAEDYNQQMNEFDKYYRAATRMAQSRVENREADYDYRNPDYYYRNVPEVVDSRARTAYDRGREPTRAVDRMDRHRAHSANEYYDDPKNTYSDFHDEGWEARDRDALERHKEKHYFRQRSNSKVIYNRRDQTHPEAYLIYVFLNGQGMECQHINFQKKQLEKGMNYVMELVARRYSVNPGRLCDMDGRKISAVSDLMSRGAYVLVPVGQSFRDTWYFLPDNAIDTSSNRDRIQDRSAQRDRLLQRREKRNNVKTKTVKKSTSRSVERTVDPYADPYKYRYD